MSSCSFCRLIFMVFSFARSFVTDVNLWYEESLVCVSRIWEVSFKWAAFTWLFFSNILSFCWTFWRSLSSGRIISIFLADSDSDLFFRTVESKVYCVSFTFLCVYSKRAFNSTFFCSLTSYLYLWRSIREYVCMVSLWMASSYRRYFISGSLSMSLLMLKLVPCILRLESKMSCSASLISEVNLAFS